MNVNVSLEQRFYLYENILYTDGAFSPKFWQRYLNVFDTVTIIARAKKVKELDPKWIQVSGAKILFKVVPHYVGIKQRILKHFEIKKTLHEICKDTKSAYIMRVGSPIADLMIKELKKNKTPYAVEVVGDPWDVFAPGAIENPLRPFLRWYFSRMLKKQCQDASYSSYVTEFALQSRYPSNKSKYSIHASSIDLKESFFHEKARSFSEIKMIFVGTLEQYQKAPDVLLKALAKVDLNIHLSFVGDGRKRPELERLVSELGLKNIHFLGKLKSPELVRNELIKHNVFVLPSRGEGLPRAMIEAMACSMVCIGSDIGGIKELIEKDYISLAGDVSSLTQTIQNVLSKSEAELENNAQRNFNDAKKYLSTILEKRRKSLYEKIKEEAMSR